MGKGGDFKWNSNLVTMHIFPATSTKKLNNLLYQSLLEKKHFYLESITGSVLVETFILYTYLTYFLWLIIFKLFYSQCIRPGNCIYVC